jgi:thioredoxin-dependent peroxiredoxin
MWLFSNPLPANTPAPDFSLPDDSGHIVQLSNLRGRPVILVFYPGDDTPGCTKQLCQFRDHWTEVQSSGTAVFGINPQNASKHQQFRKKFNLPFPLLVDKGRKVAALYHANGIIIKRTVYVIDPAGTIRFAERGAPSPKEMLSIR